jgi:ribulose-5-phosphate 4-epimerase/fuculose-1-phosphate aldolase
MHLEAVLHTEVYRRRDDVGAIVHGHPPYATAFAATDAELLHLTHDAVMFDRGVALYDGSADLITEPAQGSEVAETLGEQSVVLLRNHGVLVAQRDLPWLVLAAVTLERAVMLQSIAATLGTARPIEPVLIDDLHQRKYHDGLVAEYWQAWLRDLRRRGLDDGMEPQ